MIRKGNEYHAVNNAINKNLFLKSQNIIFWVKDKQSSHGSRTIRGLRYPQLILERLGFCPCTFYQDLVYLSKYLIFLQIVCATSNGQAK